MCSECRQFCSMRRYTGAERRKKKEGEGRRMGGTGTMAYPHRCRPITNGLLTRTTTGTCDSGSIRVLHADDANDPE